MAASTPRERLARAGGWLAFLLVLLMLGSVGEAVYAAGWSEGLAVVRVAIIGSALLAFALALTRWTGLFPLVYSLLASVFCITVFQQRVLLPELSTHDAVVEIAQRNAGWLLALVSGGPAADNLVFVTQISYLGWWLGFFAVWSIFRHQQVLTAAVPAGVALLVNLYYSPVNLSGYLLVFLVALLLLAMKVELAQNETRWRVSRIRYAPDIYLDFIKAGFVFALIVATLAWAMPDLVSRVSMERLLRPFEEPWKSVEETWSRMYQSLNYPRTAAVVPKYGKSLSLGGPVSLTDRPILEGEFPERTYWRAAVYDRYDGRGWLDTSAETQIIEHGSWLGEPLYEATVELTATVRLLEQGQDVIFAPPNPVRVSVPVDANLARISPDGALVSIALLRSRIPLGPNTAYRVTSAVTQAPADALRADSTDYPPWVTARYLQVPADIPPRVVALAEEITAPYDNPFDKAAAVEAYLRGYEYDQTIAAPPQGADGVDYFLFEIKRGYCDYYASAMALLLRIAGIPSRLVAGYAPGDRIPAPEGWPASADVYRVVERDAHSWVEAFFPTYGWIQFEPTAALPLLVRPIVREAQPALPTPPPTVAEEENLADLRAQSASESSDLEAGQQRNLLERLAARWPIWAALLGAIFLAGAVGLVANRRLAALRRDPQLLVRLFARLGTWARRLRVPWPASDTPLEHAARLGERVPQAQPAVNRLATLLAAQVYGRQQPDTDALAATLLEWQQLQSVFWGFWLREWFGFVRRIRQPHD